MPAHEAIITTAAITSSQQVSPSGIPALLYGYKFIGGVTSQTVITFNNGGSSGTALWIDSMVAQSAAGNLTQGITFMYPIIFGLDLYVTIAGGTGTSVNVMWINLK
jgi:hypothetical protein